ncbi:hypothetical protein Cfor_07322 [Coptotermes formosanus]|jgi:hypothetical protein|uniref:Uncharacterized protein n=1 Tax=Coptotermes formosanus TaxID=36987 RepID=A0A6L2PK15_COPFO|nr:hypothetical protein Cfor_07322 [Coptotermes formosanus]
MHNRSLSLSEFPASRQISAEEHNSEVAGQPLMTRYSSEKILHGAEKFRFERTVQELCVSDGRVTSWKTCTVKYEGPAVSLKKYCENLNIQSPKTDPKLIPPKEGKIDTLPVPEVVRSQSLLPRSSTHQRNNCIMFVFLPVVFVVTAVVACSSLYFASYRRVCEVSLDVDSLKSVLESSVFGQKHAIGDIVSTLNTFCSTRDPGIILMALLGGTGVGKSYTTSIISEFFPWKENVQHYVLPLHSSSLLLTDVYAKISSCGDNLIVIDGLVPSETDDIVKFLQVLTKHSQSSDGRVIVILVFSSEDQKAILQGYGDQKHQLEVSKEELYGVFHHGQLEVTIITFQALQRDHITMCIKAALNQKRIVWSTADIEEVMAHLSQDTGCKGVASKVQLIEKQYV